jgi:epoxyqueuosine reductase
MNASEVKKQARALGADLVGIAPHSRWADWPAEHNPRSIMPQCQSVIVLGRKILRGAFRGIEEGTNFGSTYGNFGRSWAEFTFLTRVIYNLACTLESSGAEAVPMSGGTPKGQQNVQLEVKALAQAAGLGSIGKGGFFLTPQYGHRQRLALLLTDLELPGDELCELNFCQDCQACVEACPLQAYSCQDGTITLNSNLCQQCQNGASSGGELSCEPLDRLAASCGRACLVALEDKIEERFLHKFRKRAVWQRDLLGHPTVLSANAKGEVK